MWKRYEEQNAKANQGVRCDLQLSPEFPAADVREKCLCIVIEYLVPTELRISVINNNEVPWVISATLKPQHGSPSTHGNRRLKFIKLRLTSLGSQWLLPYIYTTTT